MVLYEGRADLLGTFLRSAAQWYSSSATMVQIGQRQVNGWHVTERRSNIDWLLLELDGTLIAVRTPTPERVAVIGELRPVDKVTR